MGYIVCVAIRESRNEVYWQQDVINCVVSAHAMSFTKVGVGKRSSASMKVDRCIAPFAQIA